MARGPRGMRSANTVIIIIYYNIIIIIAMLITDYNQAVMESESLTCLNIIIIIYIYILLYYIVYIKLT